MNIKKAIVLPIAAVVTLSSAAGTFAYADDGANTDDKTIKIMCIGDSITDGYGTEGSYRKFLYHNLTDYLSTTDYKIDMVGMKDGGYTPSYTDEETGETFTYDNENTGYSGYAIEQYNGRSGIYETIKDLDTLKKTSPDMVILQIGTNDVIDNHELDKAGDRLTVLVNYILDNVSADSQIFVTTIPDLDPNRSDVYSWFGNYRHSADWQTQYDDETAEKNVHTAVADYNKTVESTINTLSAEHKNLHFENVNSAITDVKTQLKDGVHPNNTGYKLMGNYWTGVIENYLPIVDDKTTTATNTTTATTTVTTEPTSITSTTETTATSTAAETTSTTSTTSTALATSTVSTTETQPETIATTSTSAIPETTVTTTDTTTQSTTVPPTTTVTETTTTTTDSDVIFDTVLKTDIDQNGVFDINDIEYLQDYIVKSATFDEESFKRADSNGDGKVDVIDLARYKIFVQILAKNGYTPQDVTNAFYTYKNTGDSTELAKIVALK